MAMLIRILFWLLVTLVAYAYAGYAACVLALARLRPRPARSAEILPTVSLIIPCYNEAAYIAQKIENSLSLDYPRDSLQILVISSGSDDGTEAIVANYADAGVSCIVEPCRAGKEAAMQHATQIASGEILIFTDANALINRDALRLIVRWFADPDVGCVSGEKRVCSTNPQRSGSAEGLYWRYESALKRLDSLVGSTMGAAGELLAIRTALVTFRETDSIIEDFVLSMRVIEAGHRVVYEPGAVALEDAPASFEDVFERRARIAAGGFQALWRLRSLLNPGRGLVWWQYVSHRALRWAVVPFLLPGIIALNARSARSGRLYRAGFVLQLLFYGSALVGWWRRDSALGRCPVFYFPFFFSAMNAAVVVGFVRWVSGRQTVLWKRTRR